MRADACTGTTLQKHGPLHRPVATTHDEEISDQPAMLCRILVMGAQIVPRQGRCTVYRSPRAGPQPAHLAASSRQIKPHSESLVLRTRLVRGATAHEHTHTAQQYAHCSMEPAACVIQCERRSSSRSETP